MPIIDKTWLSSHSEGLIALSGGRQGEIGVALVSSRYTEAETALREMMALFPDRFYLELQRTNRPDEEDFIHAAVALAERCECPVVATNDVRFIESSEFEAHEARVCIYEGRALDDPRRERRYSESQYLKSPEEMTALFSDIPEALQNGEIAKRCNVDLSLANISCRIILFQRG